MLTSTHNKMIWEFKSYIIYNVLLKNNIIELEFVFSNIFMNLPGLSINIKLNIASFRRIR